MFYSNKLFQTIVDWLFLSSRLTGDMLKFLFTLSVIICSVDVFEVLTKLLFTERKITCLKQAIINLPLIFEL